MDSLDGMPEFGKPDEEKVPLVVPDQSEPLPVPNTDHVLSPDFRCKGVNKKGAPCSFPKRRDSLYCTAHDPAITKEMRNAWLAKGRRNAKNPAVKAFGPKKKQDLLELLSRRLDAFEEKFGGMSSPEVESTFCMLAKTYCYILTAEGANEEEVGGKWRIGSRAV